MIDRHEIRLVLDPAGNPVGASATTVLDDGGYRVRPLEPAPFDTPGEVLTELLAGLELASRLF